ncbi:hypothetical protein [Candidatus Thiodiazotropha sp. CDECU1]|uniref:hypothetical protein n=1 Tax=Candidatus Thiodiazotropha sp. CDECU1 TaxID=3065865 RepID=UPI002930D4A6|nr:hypothetical protein [Candidatus Thiodiazotropha sp. CDECU1]
MKRLLISILTSLVAVGISIQASAHVRDTTLEATATTNLKPYSIGAKEMPSAPLRLAGDTKTTIKVKGKTKTRTVDEDGNVTKTKVKIKSKTTTTSSSDNSSDSSSESSSSGGYYTGDSKEGE